jgi:hypothetical protein
MFQATGGDAAGGFGHLEVQGVVGDARFVAVRGEPPSALVSPTSPGW